MFAVVATASAAPQQDLPIAQAIRTNHRSALHVKVVHRSAVDRELDLVVAFAAPRVWPQSIGFWWSPHSVVAVFLQRRAEPGVVFKIVVEQGSRDDCMATVERASTTDVVIACLPEKTRRASSHKFVYDLRAKLLVKHVVYPRFQMHRVLTHGSRAVLVGTDFHRVAAVEYRAGHEPPVRLLSGSEAHRWITQVTYLKSTFGSAPNEHIELVSDASSAFTPVPFGSSQGFQLSRDVARSDGVDPRLFILEKNGRKTKKYQLPQSGPGPEMNEEIGPWQILDNQLWFAKTFYNGEGMTGVGGFGYFDTDSRAYRIFSPQAIRRWSATAMLVEKEAVWLGLTHRGEWADSSGGIARVAQGTNKVAVIPMREIVLQIVRVGEALVVATDFGIAIVEGDKMRRFLVDETTDGQLRVVEGISFDAAMP